MHLKNRIFIIGAIGVLLIALARESATQATLPKALVSVLPMVKAKTRIPVLLPSELPEPIAGAHYAVVQKTDADEYAISLYFKLGVGDAGFAAFFAAQAHPKYNSRELGNEVQLVHGTHGFFRPVSCGGSCAPASLLWELGGNLYQIQLEMSSTLSEADQQKAIISTADSAILAGPR
jgi:hypothetical protein